MPITLTTPYQVSGPPGEPTETDAYIAVAGISVDQISQLLTLTCYFCTAEATNAGMVTGVTPSTASPPVVVTVNCKTGAWSSTLGQSGILTGASLTGAQGWLANALTSTMKNQAEAAWISMGLFPGTEVQWQ